jgi:Activator of Hsp90 ATPase homolog 1-like protein
LALRTAIEKEEHAMTATADNGWALSVTRYIAAPPSKVWTVMTERQAEWWCPLPWRAEFPVQEWRAGGSTRCIMYGPDGEVHPHDGIFLEVTPGVRFVSSDAFVVDAARQYMPTGPFMVGCWEISPEGEDTRYTGTRTRPSATPTWALPKAGAHARTSWWRCVRGEVTVGTI